MSCPKCHDPRADRVFEMVGRHVRFLAGVPECGFIGACPRCQAWDFELCRPWCAPVIPLSLAGDPEANTPADPAAVCEGQGPILTGNSELTERSPGVGPAQSRVGCRVVDPASRVTPATPRGEVAPSPADLINREPRTWVCECGQVNTDDLEECYVCAWPKE